MKKTKFDLFSSSYSISYIKKRPQDKRALSDFKVFVPMPESLLPKPHDDVVMQEAQQLGFFLDCVNKVDFNNACTPWSSSTMVYRHLSGRAALTIDSAQVYAFTIGCSVSDFSPRITEQVKKICDDLSFGRLPALSWEDALTPFKFVVTPHLPPVAKDRLERSQAMLDWRARLDRLTPHDREFVCPVAHSISSFVLPVTFRESMYDNSIFNEGEHIFIDPLAEPEPEQYVIAKTNLENRALLCRLAVSDDARFLVLCDVRYFGQVLPLSENAVPAIIGAVLYKGSKIC